MSGFRTAANILAARSFRSLGTGDWESAARDAATIQRLSWLVGQDPMLISRLIAVAIRGIGVGLLPRLAATAPTTTTRDRALLAEVTAIEDLPEVTTALDESERALLLGALLHLRRLAMTSGSGAWIDELEPLDMLAGLGAGRSISMRTLYSIDPRAVDWNQAFQLVNRHFDASVAVAAEPDPQRGSELTRAFEKDFEWLASSPITPPLGFDRRAGRTHASCLLDPTCLFAAYTPTRLVVSALGLGSLIRARVSWNEAQAQYRLALRALELAIEQRERGSFPAELELPRALDGYAYRYHPGPPLPERLGRAARFAVTTVPLVRDETGVRGFCVDGEGRLHQELDGSAPDVIEGRCLGGSSVR